MSCLYQRPRNPKTGVFWIGFYHPITGALVRASLETTDPKVAKKLRKTVDARCGAAGPIDVDMPSSIVEILRELEPKPTSAPLSEGAHKEGEKSVSQPVRGCGTPQPMAAIYPRPADAPDPIYWVAVYHPRTGALIRRSLETRNREEALRKAQRIEALCGVISTQEIDVPGSILEDIGWNPFVKNLSATNPAQPAVLVVKRCTVEEALRSLLSNMLVGNDDHYLDGTLSIARRLFGSDLVDRVDPRPTPPEPKDKRKAKRGEAGIDSILLSDITSEKMTVFFAKQAFSSDTCRHYKEFVRKLINHAIKSGIHVPENPFAPNPMNGLPSFVDREREIVVLSQENEKEQMAVIATDWRVSAATKILIETGMRPHELFSVRVEDVFLDNGYLRLLKNARHSQQPQAKESGGKKRITLKRGERTVALDEETVEFLRSHIQRLKSEGYLWLVPSPAGGRWNANDYGKALHEFNGETISFTAQDFRHTYATRKITLGWPLRVLAQQMGTSVKMLETHYAGYIPPEALKYVKK